MKVYPRIRKRQAVHEGLLSVFLIIVVDYFLPGCIYMHPIVALWIILHPDLVALFAGELFFKYLHNLQ